MKKHTHFKSHPAQHGTAMVRNLLTSFFVHKALVTTHKRAKAISPLIDKLINVAKADDRMNAIRTTMTYLYTEESSRALFEQVAPQYTERTSGFSRITPIKYRDGDNAKLVKIELA